MLFLINGGEFNNKGAEAMTLIAISEIKRRFPQASIFMNYNPGNSELEKNIDLNGIYLNNYFFDIVTSRSIKSTILNLRLFFTNRRYYTSIPKGKELLAKVDCYIDISGFALSSKWSEKNNELYLNKIDAIRKLSPKCKIFLMPQSFGPFEYKNTKMKTRIKRVLNKCDHIFVREQGGFDVLSELGLKNISLSTDSVLQVSKIDYPKFVSNFETLIEEFNFSQNKAVGIIPNYRLIDTNNNNEEKLVELYKNIILKLKGYKIYLLGHAGEDLVICKKIKDIFCENDEIELVDYILSSFNYQKLAAKLDFIVASRYHSIIHAYKEGTPAIIIGWAEKYNSLAALFAQEEYIADLDKENEVLLKLEKMMNNHDIERNKILNGLVDIQRNSCYSFLDKEF